MKDFELDKDERIQVRTPRAPEDDKDDDKKDDETKPDEFTEAEYLLSDSKVMEMYLASIGSDKDDAYDVSSRLFNSPFHLLPSADTVINTKVGLGRKYMENIASNTAIVFVMPVTTRFMPGLDKDRQEIFKTLLGDAANGNTDSDAISSIIEGVDTKFFDSKPAYYEYMKYVNLLCRAFAVYLGIGETTGPDNKTKLKSYHWENYKYRNFAEETKSNGNIFEKAADNIKDEAMKHLFSDFQYVQFYADVDTQASESYSSNVGDSMMAGVLDKGADMARELQFTLSGAGLGTASNLYNTAATQIGDLFSQFSSEGGIFDRLGAAAMNVLKGANIIVPQIWTGSEATPSQSFKIDLGGPYGDTYSIFMERLVPFAHVLAFSIPRQNDANSHASPFLVRSFSKGWFSSELGIVTNLSVDKTEWNADGLPARITLNLTITDLYKDLMISKTTEPNKFMANLSLIDYIGMTTGVDISKPHIKIQIDVMAAMFLNAVFDTPTILYQDSMEGIRNIMANMWDYLKF